MQKLLSVLARKQDEIIRVQKDIEILKDWIRQQDARDAAVTAEANDALIKQSQEQVELLAGEIEERSRQADRGARGSSLLGIFLCGLLLGAMVLVGVMAQDVSSSPEPQQGAKIALDQ